jgi:hypothetical protein
LPDGGLAVWGRGRAGRVGDARRSIGSKILLALLAARSRRFLAGRAYRAVMRALALLLGLFALLLFREGWLLLAAM